MVYRIYVEKKQGLTAEADALRNDIVNLLGIKGLTGLRLMQSSWIRICLITAQKRYSPNRSWMI